MKSRIIWFSILFIKWYSIEYTDIMQRCTYLATFSMEYRDFRYSIKILQGPLNIPIDCPPLYLTWESIKLKFDSADQLLDFYMGSLTKAQVDGQYL